jgi:hypothetical protein
MRKYGYEIISIPQKDAALAMMPSLRPPWTAISCELVTIDRENGSVTIALKVRPHYMRIIIR